MGKTRKIIVDPPAGWKYGFPRVLGPYDENQTIENSSSAFIKLLKDSGYPEELMDLALNHSRFWVEDGDDC